MEVTSFLMNIKRWIKQRLTQIVEPSSSALIIIGVDYSSYQRLDYLRLSRNHRVVFVIDDKKLTRQKKACFFEKNNNRWHKLNLQCNF